MRVLSRLLVLLCACLQRPTLATPALRSMRYWLRSTGPYGVCCPEDLVVSRE